MTLGTLTSGFGTGAVGTLAGTDTYGYVKLTTGTGTSNGQSLSLKLSQTHEISRGTGIRLFPIDATTQALGVSATLSDGPNGEYDINVNSGIADSTTYQWAYRID